MQQYGVSLTQYTNHRFKIYLRGRMQIENYNMLARTNKTNHKSEVHQREQSPLWKTQWCLEGKRVILLRDHRSIWSKGPLSWGSLLQHQSDPAEVSWIPPLVKCSNKSKKLICTQSRFIQLLKRQLSPRKGLLIFC